MENVILVIHLLLALGLIGVVLLQRSEGGGLGIGGSSGGVMSARGAATALGKVTWILAVAFLATSIGLTILSAKNAADSSVIDRVTETPAATTPATGTETPAADATATTDTTAPATTDTAPAATETAPADPNAPVAPPRAD